MPDLATRLRGLARSAGLDLLADGDASHPWVTLVWEASPQITPYVLPLAAPERDTLGRVERELDDALFLAARWRDEPGLALAPLSAALGIARATLRQVMVPAPPGLTGDQERFEVRLYEAGVHAVRDALARAPDASARRFAQVTAGALEALNVGIAGGANLGSARALRLEQTVGALLRDQRGLELPDAALGRAVVRLLETVRHRPELGGLTEVLEARADPLAQVLNEPRFAAPAMSPLAVTQDRAGGTPRPDLFRLHQTRYDTWLVAATPTLGSYARLVLACPEGSA